MMARWDPSAASGLWTEVALSGAVPPACDKLSCAVSGGRLLLWGGFGPVGGEEDMAAASPGAEQEEEQAFLNLGWFGDLFAVDTATGLCTKVSTEGPRPTPRAAHAICCTDSPSRCLWLFGGKDMSGRQNDLHRLDLGEETALIPLSLEDSPSRSWPPSPARKWNYPNRPPTSSHAYLWRLARLECHQGNRDAASGSVFPYLHRAGGPPGRVRRPTGR